MHKEELAYWLALWRTPGVGSSLFGNILERYPDLSSLFQLDGTQLRACGFNQVQISCLKGFHLGEASPLIEGVQRDLEWLEQSDLNHIVTWAHEEYPPLLRQIKGSPPLIFVRGDYSCLNLPQIAIVGSRNCSRNGRKLAHDFSGYFSEQGFITSSGLALGVDTFAHRGALAAGGKTVAVLAHGLDDLYPKRNRALAAEVVENGALVSELPIGVNPKPEYFPRRNRIISGLSLGVLVVEAALKSGSLITAHEAVDQGREVFAIPGSINDPLVKGCHGLIRNGAKLVENAQHVVEELAPLLGFMQQTSLDLDQDAQLSPYADGFRYADGSSEARLLNSLEYEPVSLDKLVGLTGLAVAEVSSALVLLEMDGVVAQRQGGYYLI